MKAEHKPEAGNYRPLLLTMPTALLSALPCTRRGPSTACCHSDAAWLLLPVPSD